MTARGLPEDVFRHDVHAEALDSSRSGPRANLSKAYVKRYWLGLSLFAIVGLLPARAHAVEAEVYAETAAQGYAFRSPWGEPIVSRRRFLQTIGLGVYELQGERNPRGPSIFFRGRMRLDSDFGIADEELVYDPASRRFVPGLRRGEVDFMYGYIEGRRLFGGWFGFRLGRQYTSDALGLWSFDGGLVRFTTPYYVRAELYGGFEQRGGLPLSTPRFEQNGIWRGDRVGFDTSVHPAFHQARLAPAYGFALESTSLSWLSARFDYRKVNNLGETVVQMFPDPVTGTFVKESGTRVSSERAGGRIAWTLADVMHVNAGAVYDFYNALFASYHGAVDWHPAPHVTAGIDYEHYRPTFDGDSIFNFFAQEPMQTATLRLAWQLSSRFDVAGSGGVRLFGSEGDFMTSPRDDAASLDWLGHISARQRFSTAEVGLRGLAETGERGSRFGSDLFGEKRFLGDRWLAQARTSLYRFHDALRPYGAITSFAYMTGFGFRPHEETLIRLEWEHATNRLVGQRYRVLAMLDVSVK